MPETSENIKLEEIEKLERELAEKRAAFEDAGVERKEAEITRENLGERPAQTIPSQQPTAAAVVDEKAEEIKNDVREIKNLDTARQVKVLVALAFEKGITHSVKVARGLNDAYLLDELHELLVAFTVLTLLAGRSIFFPRKRCLSKPFPSHVTIEVRRLAVHERLIRSRDSVYLMQQVLRYRIYVRRCNDNSVRTF